MGNHWAEESRAERRERLGPRGQTRGARRAGLRRRQPRPRPWKKLAGQFSPRGPNLGGEGRHSDLRLGRTGPAAVWGRALGSGSPTGPAPAEIRLLSGPRQRCLPAQGGHFQEAGLGGARPSGRTRKESQSSHALGSRDSPRAGDLGATVSLPTPAPRPPASHPASPQPLTREEAGAGTLELPGGSSPSRRPPSPLQALPLVWPLPFPSLPLLLTGRPRLLFSSDRSPAGNSLSQERLVGWNQ